MNRLTLVALSAISGIILAAAWPAIGGLSLLLFVGLLPLLYVEDQVTERGYTRVYWYAYIGFFFFNLLTTWWIYCVEESMGTKLFSVCAPVFLNPLFMAAVFQLFHFTKKHLGRTSGYASLIIYWMGFEYLHLRWELSWPWLTLGNGFSNSTDLIQWYEYTGVSGGSLWVVGVNVLLYLLLKHFAFDRKTFRAAVVPVVSLALLLCVPLVSSFAIRNSYTEENNPVNIVAVQPNIDPYTEKYSLPGSEQLQKMFSVAKAAGTPETDCFVFPETAFPANLYEGGIADHSGFHAMLGFLNDFPDATMLMGMSSVKRFYSEADAPPTARQSPNDSIWRDNYNTALYIEPDSSFEFYHKSMLVLAVEKMPFATLLKPLQSFALDMGGTTVNLGTQETRSVFGKEGGPRLAPIICYESIYGEYVGDYALNGADVFCIMTNDAWWNETPGHLQHLSYARLRAIEHRRSIARAANTGISCFIDQLGNVTQATTWKTDAAIAGTLNRNSKLTFYTRHGDYLSRTAAFFAVLLIIWTYVRKRANKKNPSTVQR